MSTTGTRVGYTCRHGLTSAYVEDTTNGIGADEGLLDIPAALIHTRRHEVPNIGEEDNFEFLRVE